MKVMGRYYMTAISFLFCIKGLKLLLRSLLLYLFDKTHMGFYSIVNTE
jgi:hypothetical protein